MITARFAGEQGRLLFAVPGRIDQPSSAGCHQLLRDGAALVETVDDILSELQPGLVAAPATARREPAARAAMRAGDAGLVLDALGYDSVPMDVLLRRTTLTPSTLSSILLSLEIAGEVVVRPGGNFERVPAPPP